MTRTRTSDSTPSKRTAWNRFRPEERTLDGCREAREVLLAQADSRDLRKSAHDREREDVVVVHRQRRTIKRALDRLAVDDDDLAAEVVDTPEPEVPDRARFGDAQARLIGAGEQRVDHGELRHGGTGHRRQSHHRWSVPMLGGHDESRNSNARSAARACCASEPSATRRPAGPREPGREPATPAPCSHSTSQRGGRSVPRGWVAQDAREALPHGEVETD